MGTVDVRVGLSVSFGYLASTYAVKEARVVKRNVGRKRSPHPRTARGETDLETRGHLERSSVQTLFEVGHHMAVLLAGSLAFSLGAGRATVFVALQRHPTIALVAPIVDTAEKAEQFWAIPSAARPLLRVGKAGASRSHANGLADLCSSHPAVSVRFTGTASAASLEPAPPRHPRHKRPGRHQAPAPPSPRAHMHRR